MSYSTGHLISQDTDLRNRAAIAAAEQGVAAGEEEHWVYRNVRRLATQPGWGAAWESGLLARENPDHGLPPIGLDPAVITDGMILSAVQKLLGVQEA
jgi:hypothetical protein